METLVANETGRVVLGIGEEVNDRRHARTRLVTVDELTALYVLAAPHSPESAPLSIAVNGIPFGTVQPVDDPTLRWWRISAPPGAQVNGEAEVVLSSAGSAMVGWSLAIDPTCGGDEISTDGGRSWQAERLGYLHTGPGRYVVRGRDSGGVPQMPPKHRWENPDLAKALYERLSPPVDLGRDTLATVRALSTWVCRAWWYRNTSEASLYAPWDPESILSWGKAERGFHDRVPVVMCVHYAIVLTALCQALGIPARCAAVTQEVNGANGHFVSEVFLAETGRWAMVDPTYDALFIGDDGPLSVRELSKYAGQSARFFSAGPGFAERLRSPAGRAWYESVLLDGHCFAYHSVWPRSDFLAHPEFSPPGHGACAYSETDLVWGHPSAGGDLGMFRYVANDEWFDSPPCGMLEC